MAAGQPGDPEILALKTTGMGLKLEDSVVQEGGPKILCDVSTGHPHPIVPVSWFTHPGVQASVKLVGSKFVCPGLHKEVKEWVAACVACQPAKVNQHTKAPPLAMYASQQTFRPRVCRPGGALVLFPGFNTLAHGSKSNNEVARGGSIILHDICGCGLHFFFWLALFWLPY